MIEKYFLKHGATIESGQIASILRNTLDKQRSNGTVPAHKRLNEALDDLDNQRLKFIKYAVPEELRPFISSWSYLEDYSGRYKTERAIPQCGASLIINLKEERAISNSPYDAHAGTVVLFKDSMDIQNPGYTRRIYVHFTAAGLYLLTGVSQQALVNQFTDARFIFGQAFTTLYDQLVNSDSSGEYLKFLTGFFVNLQLKTQWSGQADLIRFMINHIDAPIISTAAKTGYTRKHVLNLFKQFTGCSPKQFQLTQKLHRIMLQFDPVQHSLFKLTDAEDFHDEAHFCRAFKKTTGMRPLQYKHEGFYCTKRILFH